MTLAEDCDIEAISRLRLKSGIFIGTGDLKVYASYRILLYA